MLLLVSGSSSIVAREYDVCKYLGDVDVCRVFDVSKVKVPVLFPGTEGFPPHRDGREQD